MVVYQPSTQEVDFVSIDQIEALKQEIESLKKCNEETKVRKQIYGALEKFLEHRIKMVIDKAKNVHECYASLSQEIE